MLSSFVTLAQELPRGLSIEELANASYIGIYGDDLITLTNGVFAGKPFVEGGSSRPTVIIDADLVVYGDFTGDGQMEAGVLLDESSGGTGNFIYLAIVASEDGQPVNLATTLLGDRVQVKSMTIEENTVEVDMVQAGPDDPLCCPKQRVLNTYQLGLVLVSSEEVVVQLAGPIWQWERTVMNNDEIIVPPDPVNYNVKFNDDGSVTIQADCNSVLGTYSLEDSKLSLEMGPSTMVACSEDSLGDRFVAQLASATIYFFDRDMLLIDLTADSGTMHFSQQSTELAGTSWIVTGYNNGNQAVISPIIDTELTLSFGDDGTVNGSAGCNGYSSTYEANGSSIAFGMMTSTMMACAEPEGIMEQEQRYLAALEAAARLNLRGDRLELRRADGALAVSLVRTR